MLSYKRRLNFKLLFNEEKNPLEILSPNKRKIIFTGSARGGIETCIDLFRLKETDSVLLPAFVPEGVIAPFKKKRLKLTFYKCDIDLKVDIDDLKKRIHSSKTIRAMVIIHYFGFPQDLTEITRICKKFNIILFEDCAQALFSKDDSGNSLGSFGNIAFFSFPKFIPVPDGALFMFNDLNIKLNRSIYQIYKRSFFHVLSITFHFFFLIFKYYELKLNYSIIYSIFNSISKFLYALYYQFLRLMRKPTRMSNLSKKIAGVIDYNILIEKRKSNTRYFYKHIDKKKFKLVFPHFNNNYVLTGIPIISKKRNEIVKKLKRKGIECLCYVKCWDFIPFNKKNEFKNEVDFLNKHFLIPINENINLKNMKYIIETMNQLKLT